MSTRNAAQMILEQLRYEEPLRAKPLPRLNPTRDAARGVEKPIMLAACRDLRVSNRAIADAFGNASERAGAQIVHGGTVSSSGEVALLFPVEVSAKVLLTLLRVRIDLVLEEEANLGRREDLKEARRLLERAEHLIVSGSAS